MWPFIWHELNRLWLRRTMVIDSGMINGQRVLLSFIPIYFCVHWEEYDVIYINQKKIITMYPNYILNI